MGCSEWCKEEFNPRNFGFGHPRPQLTVSSQWDRMSPVVYLVWRWFAAVYHLAWIIVSVAAATIYTVGKDTWFAYLTNWTYFLLTLNVMVEAIAALIWFLYQRNPNNELPKTTTWYMKLAWFMNSMTTATTILVGVVYWALIYSPNSQEFYIDLQTHGITIIYVIMNMIITGMPVRIYHLIYPILFGILYTVFTVIYYSAGGVNKDGGVYIYKEILDWRDVSTSMTWISILLFVGLPVIHVLLVYGGHMIRVLVYNQCYMRRNRTADESELSKLGNQHGTSYDAA